MNINRSSAVDLFKKYGKSWYYGAQKLPIDAYKDIILLHEFAYHMIVLSHQGIHGQEQLTTIVHARHQAYQTKNIEHPHYGGIIEMLYRRKITEEPIRDLLQSALLNTTTIAYHTYDELKVYISGIAEGVSMMVADIIGCAPPGHPYAKALGESTWLIHLLLDLPKDYQTHSYIPVVDMDEFGVTHHDMTQAIRTKIPSQGVRNIIKHYLDEHEQLSNYAVQGIGYFNTTGHRAISEYIKFYEQYVILIQQYNYNVFHPRFISGLPNKIIGYIVYRYYTITGTKQ